MQASGPEARLTHRVLLIMVVLAVSGLGCGGTGPGTDPGSRSIDASTAGLGQAWAVIDAQAAGLSDPYAVHPADVIDGPLGDVAVGGVSAPDGRSWQRVAHDDVVFGSAE